MASRGVLRGGWEGVLPSGGRGGAVRTLGSCCPSSCCPEMKMMQHKNYEINKVRKGAEAAGEGGMEG